MPMPSFSKVTSEKIPPPIEIPEPEEIKEEKENDKSVDKSKDDLDKSI